MEDHELWLNPEICLAPSLLRPRNLCTAAEWQDEAKQGSSVAGRQRLIRTPSTQVSAFLQLYSSSSPAVLTTEDGR